MAGGSDQNPTISKLIRGSGRSLLRSGRLAASLPRVCFYPPRPARPSAPPPLRSVSPAVGEGRGQNCARRGGVAAGAQLFPGSPETGAFPRNPTLRTHFPVDTVGLSDPPVLFFVSGDNERTYFRVTEVQAKRLQLRRLREL